jgi:integrase
MKCRITKRTVDQLAPGTFIADSEVVGFVARRRDSGAVTFGYQYRAAGKQKWITIGKHGIITAEQARAQAEKHAETLHEKKVDPAAEMERRNGTTVNAVLDRFMEVYVVENKLRSEDTIKSAFDRLVRPEIGTVSIYSLTRSQITKMLDKIAEGSGPVMADRALAYLRKALNWQMARDEQFNSPIIKGMARTKPSERRGKRILNDQEINDVWKALDRLDLGVDAPACYPRYIRSILLTGLRRSELSRAHRDEINGKEWVVPAERMKHKKPHMVPITPAVAVLFGNRSGFVFSSDDDGKLPFSGFSKAKTALGKKISAIRKTDGRKPMPKWGLHDLRRTARSIMSRYATPDIAERVIGHTIPGVRGVYDLHEYADEKRAALEKLAEHIELVTRIDSRALVSNSL